MTTPQLIVSIIYFVVCLALIGAEQMLLPALGLIVLSLLVLRGRLEDRAEGEEVAAP